MVRPERLGEDSCQEAEVKALDLIIAARLLAEQPRRGRPPEANLRRAISTAYYALFHCLAENCADMMVGGPGSRRDTDAWLQMYRALDHGTARRRCRDTGSIARFHTAIRNFADKFVEMQGLRHQSDYNPEAQVPARAQVIQYINDAESAIRRFPNAPIIERRAFAVHVLMDARRT